MDIAFDATTDGTAGSTSTQTYSHTCTGSDRILYVDAYHTTNGDPITGITYAGVSMTKVGFAANGFGSITLFRLIAPASGANNVVVTFAAGFCATVATSYTGAHQTGVYVSNTANNAFPTLPLTVTLTPNSANNWIHCADGNQGSSSTATDSAFIRNVGANIAVVAMDTNGTVGASATTMGCTQTGNGGQGLVAESFEPTGSAVRMLASLGVGT